MSAKGLALAVALCTAIAASGATSVSGAGALPLKGAKADPRSLNPWARGEAVVSLTYQADMPKRGRSQVTAELAPKTKAFLEELEAQGEILSIADFIRRSVEDAVEERYRRHRLSSKKGADPREPR